MVDLLQAVADPATKNVVLLGATYPYWLQLFSFVCRLQQLKVKNYIIAAFDELYKIAFLRIRSIVSR